ncbi:Protein of unknown function [Fodinibius roseus]|uniref:DUF3185 family protein n=1 Tax=Fodinibius roseus TaxID=1194090 RepID=A0A1M5GHF4_9BACT|nr:DUF3185 family protein [Fodinibius roseus]SHG03118.1 Protein of unknown function [Fodinibius roseus]
MMKKAIPVILLLGGLLLLYIGSEQYQSPLSETKPFFGISARSQGLWMIIVGAAAAIAGLTGLFRDRLEDSGSEL